MSQSALEADRLGSFLYNSVTMSCGFYALYPILSTGKQGRRFVQSRVHRAFCTLKSRCFFPEFGYFKHVLFPEFTDFGKRDPLLRRVCRWSMAVLLNIRADFPHFGSGPLLVIQAHQQLILKIFIRSSSDFVMCVHTSALPESPKVRQNHISP